MLAAALVVVAKRTVGWFGGKSSVFTYLGGLHSAAVA
jgi:hypothetical protein